MEGADKKAILALSFGQAGWNFGKSNEALAEVVKKLHEESDLPMFLQWEIADCITGLIDKGRI